MNKKRILIVDDDPIILKSFATFLESKGYSVSIAENGQKAMEKACADFYNLALIDIKLPDMDGTELLKKFYQFDPKMKTVMITGYATLENAVVSLNWGVDAYLLKPVTPSRLLGTVMDKLAEQECENELYEKTVNDLLRAKMKYEQSMDRWD